MTHPTKAQRRVLDWHVEHWANGPPTIQDATDSLGYASTASIHGHRMTLVRKGYMTGSGRSLELVPEAISQLYEDNFRWTCWR